MTDMGLMNVDASGAAVATRANAGHASRGALQMEWRVAHERLARFAKARPGLDWEEGRLLRAAFVAGAHVRLGFGSFAEYVERLFGYDARQTREKLRVAEALEGLSLLSNALHEGELTWSAVRELSRVTVPRTESAWLDAARGRSARDIEELVAGRRAGDLPSDPADPRVRRHVLRFEVSGETRALLGEAMAALRRESGGPLDDDAALLLMARRVLNGPSDAGRASYQVKVTLCERCGRGDQLGSGKRSAVRREVVEMFECDAQRIDHARGSAEDDAGVRAVQTIAPALRRSVMLRDGGRCVVTGCRHSTFIDVHHLVPRAAGGQHSLKNLVCLCGAHHRAVHERTLVIEGTPETGLTFWHADGRRYGDIGAVRRKEESRAPTAAVGES